MVTRERVVDLLEYDGEKLIWKISRGTAAARSAAGTIQTDRSGCQYLLVKIDSKFYRAHRLIWLLHYGEWPKQFIDHIDGNGLNNRIENLRDVSNAENGRNQRKHFNNTSGVVGVYWGKQRAKWRATINVEGKLIHLGYFADKAEAAAARKAAEIKYNYHANHGREFAVAELAQTAEKDV